MAGKEITIEDLRSQAAEQRQAWSKIPVKTLLETILKDMGSEEVRKFVDDLRPLYDAMPHDEPTRAHIGSLIGVLNGLPTVLTQRLEQLK